MRIAEQILDLARWAPSGDNTQPWRFEIRSDNEIIVHGYDTRDHCVYDLDGWGSHLSHGALLETLALAATRFSMRARIAPVDRITEQHFIYRVTLDSDPSCHEHSLVRHIEHRTVQRRPMRTRPLLPSQRSALEQAAAPYTVVWLESVRHRCRMAHLLFRNAHIRLTIPEAYAVHKAVIAWNAETSEDRLPDAALGADPVLLSMMRWAMVSWRRVSFLNRYAAGTFMPRLALDLWPAIACSAHFALIAPHQSQVMEHRINAGRSVQRFWLTATELELQLQPAFTPLVFARYARERRRFSVADQAHSTARETARALDELLGSGTAGKAVFLGRIGPQRPAKGRSRRLSLKRLIVDEAPDRLDTLD